MRLKMLSCEVLTRELYYCAATSPHIIDVHLLRRGLHDTPDSLREEIQRYVDEVSSGISTTSVGRPDAICLGYALCGNSLAGIVARDVPVILPRAHDCITLYLGSRARYQEEFTNHPGTYYYAQDYMERQDGAGGSVIPLGTANDAKRKEIYQEYVEKYGQENADYLLEVMGGWTSHYNRAAYIDMGIGDGSAVEQAARSQATSKGWSFDRLAGSLALLRKLTHGEWDDDFLRLPPGGRISVTYDANIVGCTVDAAL
jgi:hypothetical protein